MSNPFLPLAKPSKRREERLAVPHNIPSIGSIGIHQAFAVVPSPRSVLSESSYRATNMTEIFSYRQPDQSHIPKEEDGHDTITLDKAGRRKRNTRRGTKFDRNERSKSSVTEATALTIQDEEKYVPENNKPTDVLSNIQEEDIEEPSTGSTNNTLERKLPATDTFSETSVFFDEPERDENRQITRSNLPKRERSFFDRIKSRRSAFYKELVRFKGLKILQVFLACYVCFLTYADIGPPGGLQDENGLILDRRSPERTENGLLLVNGVERAIIGATKFQVIAIGISRMSAFFMYPALVMVFMSKFRASLFFLSKSPLAMHMPKDYHELHVYCGWTILIFSTIHAGFHTLRWAAQGNLYLMFQHFSGLSGFFIISSCFLICIPMTIFRTQIRYEIRKNMHYFFILFAGALMFHSPTSAIPNGGFAAYVFSTILVWYFVDATYCYFFMTEKISTTKFSVVPCGVRMTMTVSKHFQDMGESGGICYVCLPWISKNQWHAFSLFEDPKTPGDRQIFIQKTGDWTREVHRMLQRDTVRPAWVQGPFPSPYDNAISYDNQILVASGIGITPALSVIRAHKGTRRTNLIWVVRDEALLEFFLSHLYLDHEGWNLIFYTGKKKLRDECIHLEAEANICIISGRPKLDELIPNIVFGIESKLGLPEKYIPGTKKEATRQLVDQFSKLASTRNVLSDSYDVAETLAIQASELGYRLPMDALPEEAFTGRASATRRASNAILENLSMDFRPWNYYEGAKDYVKNLDEKLVLPTWGMLYCGGAKPVLKALEEVSEEFQIGLHVESFAW